VNTSSIASWLLSVLILALIAELCSRRFPGRPALAHALWLLVLARCLVPSIPLLAAWNLERPLDALSMPAPILLTVPVTLGGNELGILSVLDLLLSIWVLGFIWCAVRSVQRSFILHRCLRFARPVDASLERAVEREAKRIGVAKPTVVTLSWIQSPFLFGLRKPILIWPESGDAIVASARSSVILHELAHLKRRDPLTSCLEVAAQSLWWWNPLVWYAVAQSRRFKELACDAWVMAEQPEERNRYASALIQAIDLRTPSVLAGGSHGWIGSGSRIRERLRALYSGGMTGRLAPRNVAVVALVFLASLPGLTHSAQAPPVELTEAHSAALERFGVASFEELKERSNAEIAADPTNGRAFYELGWAFVGQGDFESAIPVFEEQYELGYTTTFASYNVSCCYARLGETEDALVWLRKSIESGYNNADAMEADPDLESLRDDSRFQAMMREVRSSLQSSRSK